jgi:hypothetical protein
VAAEAENSSAVAVVEDLEGSDFPTPDLLNQPLVGESSEEPPGLWDSERRGMPRRGGLHV